LACLKRLRHEVATERGAGADLEAWEAIRSPYEALRNEHPEDLKLLWDEIRHASSRRTRLAPRTLPSPMAE
jgi:hypothetical protein